jgi:hypothetical protein
VVTGSATNITSSAATLNAAITNAGSTGVSVKGFYYGTTPNPVLTGNVVNSESTGNEFTAYVSGLASGVQVFYCAFATNSIGTAFGSENSFTIAIATLDTPQNLVITIQSGSAVLSWGAVANAHSYKIYRSASPTSLDWGAPVAVTLTPGWTDTTPGTGYFYKVVASTD